MALGIRRTWKQSKLLPKEHRVSPHRLVVWHCNCVFNASCSCFYIVLMCETFIRDVFSDFWVHVYTLRSNIGIFIPKGRLPGSRKPPHTVTGQFQLSLQTLMEALNTANPFFIRCIKSNANKVGTRNLFVCIFYNGRFILHHLFLWR